MENPSNSGMKDLSLGFAVLIGFSAVVYLFVVKFHLIWENILLLGILVLFISIGGGLLFLGTDLVVALLDYLQIVKNSDDYTIKDPETP